MKPVAPSATPACPASNRPTARRWTTSRRRCARTPSASACPSTRCTWRPKRRQEARGEALPDAGALAEVRAGDPCSATSWIGGRATPAFTYTTIRDLLAMGAHFYRSASSATRARAKATRCSTSASHRSRGRSTRGSRSARSNAQQDASSRAVHGQPSAHRLPRTVADGEAKHVLMANNDADSSASISRLIAGGRSRR